MKGTFENRVVSVVLGIAVAALFTFLVVFGTNIYIPHADFNEARNDCYEKWYPEHRDLKPVEPYQEPTDEEAQKSEEARANQDKCLQEVERQEDQFHRTQSIAALILGVVGMAAGALIAVRVIPFAGAGFVLGGLSSIIYGLAVGGEALGAHVVFSVALGVLVFVLVISWFFFKQKPAS